MKDKIKWVWYAYHNGKWEAFKTRKEARDRVLELEETKVKAWVEYETINN